MLDPAMDAGTEFVSAELMGAVDTVITHPSLVAVGKREGPRRNRRQLRKPLPLIEALGGRRARIRQRVHVRSAENLIPIAAPDRL